VGGGVEVARIAFGDGEGNLRYEPGHPYANADGVVRYPDVDLGDQMTQMIVAQRGYQMNLAVIDRAREAYQQALRINGR
jgi:flagellar basal-body rod protein FlgC